MRIFPAFRTSIYRGFTIAAPAGNGTVCYHAIENGPCMDDLPISYHDFVCFGVPSGNQTWLAVFFLEMEVYSWENHIHGGN